MYSILSFIRYSRSIVECKGSSSFEAYPDRSRYSRSIVECKEETTGAVSFMDLDIVEA